jgi:hypothetical protein
MRLATPPVLKPFEDLIDGAKGLQLGIGLDLSRRSEPQRLSHALTTALALCSCIGERLAFHVTSRQGRRLL